MSTYPYSHTTKNIFGNFKVEVHPLYLEEESAPQKRNFCWIYFILIQNLGRNRTQLLKRHWIIIDGNGLKEEVIGEGVVGNQPIIKSKESFEYNSGAKLTTPSGTMYGTYEFMHLASKTPFLVEIPAFSLDSPYADRNLQ